MEGALPHCQGSLGLSLLIEVGTIDFLSSSSVMCSGVTRVRSWMDRGNPGYSCKSKVIGGGHD